MKPPIVFGSKALIEAVTRKDVAWPIKTVFMIEHAYAFDNTRHYWLVQLNDKSYITISSDRFYNCLGWGTIRKGEDGKMQICQTMPKEVEAALRKQTIEHIKILQEERKTTNAKLEEAGMSGVLIDAKRQ